MAIDLSSLGWDEHLATAYRRCDHPRHEPARVTTVDRGVYGLLAAAGPARAGLGGGLLAAAARDRGRLPCAGDWVVLRDWPDDRVTVEAVLPRRGLVTAAGLRMSNVDILAVVVPAVPEPDPAEVRRLRALAAGSGVPVVVVVTKSDLVPRPARWSFADHVVSARRGDGIDSLRRLVGPGRTLALLGGSGAGKSAVVNALAGAIVMPTHAARRVDRRGRQATTRAALVALPGGGAVVDTPGLVAGLPGERSCPEDDLRPSG